MVDREKLVVSLLRAGTPVVDSASWVPLLLGSVDLSVTASEELVIVPPPAGPPMGSFPLGFGGAISDGVTDRRRLVDGGGAASGPQLSSSSTSCCWHHRHRALGQLTPRYRPRRSIRSTLAALVNE